MALEPPALQTRSMSKRWSSIITQPSSFLKQQASEPRHKSDARSASSNTNRRPSNRSKRWSRIPSTSHEDPWEIRSISCCEFDRIRRTYLPDHDTKESDLLFRRLATANSQMTDYSPNTPLNAMPPVPVTASPPKPVYYSPPVPKQATQLRTTASVYSIPKSAPPRPLKSCRRVSLHQRPSSVFVHESTLVNRQGSYDSLRSRSSYLSLKTPPLDAGVDTRSLSSTSEFGDTALDKAEPSSTPSPAPSYKLTPATPESNVGHDRSIWLSPGYAEQLSPLSNKGPNKPLARLSMPLYPPSLQQVAPPIWT